MQSNQIDIYLKTLSLHRIGEIYKQEAENAANTKISYQDYLLRLLEAQVLSKIERSVKQWDEIFNDDIDAGAILDRLLHHPYPLSMVSRIA